MEWSLDHPQGGAMGWTNCRAFGPRLAETRVGQTAKPLALDLLKPTLDEMSGEIAVSEPYSSRSVVMAGKTEEEDCNGIVSGD
jgi:hypothetical protein